MRSGCYVNLLYLWIFKHILGIDILSIQVKWHWKIPEDTVDDRSRVVKVNGLLPSGSKPLPEPVLTKISDAI